MLLNENEWCQAMMGSDSKKTFKEYLYDSYMCGDSVKSIAKIIGKSTSTVYRIINTFYSIKRFPELEKEIKQILFSVDFKTYIESLNY